MKRNNQINQHLELPDSDSKYSFQWVISKFDTQQYRLIPNKVGEAAIPSKQSEMIIMHHLTEHKNWTNILLVVVCHAKKMHFVVNGQVLSGGDRNAEANELWIFSYQNKRVAEENGKSILPAKWLSQHSVYDM